jgi:hypothetical protein
MAITRITGNAAFGTGSADVLSRETTKEYSQIVEGKDGNGDITDVIGIGKKTTVRETKLGSDGADLAGNVTNVVIAASNEDFTKTTVTSVTYQT